MAHWLVPKLEEFAKKFFADKDSAHDWDHTDRVRRNALQIAEAEGARLDIVELAALLHDIGDYKFHKNHTDGPLMVTGWLAMNGHYLTNSLSRKDIDFISDICESISYKGPGQDDKPVGLEGKCVMDADRLDAMGAIGIGRCFAFGGANHRKMFDLTEKPDMTAKFGTYKVSTSSSIGHFYEKLLLLKDRMQTNTGRAMAISRHKFMEEFLAEFLTEWTGRSHRVDESEQWRATCVNCLTRPSGPTHPQLCEPCYNEAIHSP